jgi:GT2 family glycosyltransferase
VKLSVVIPTFNRRAILEVTLNALARQSYPDFEVVVVDDGSTDGTGEWLETLSFPFPLKAITQTNGGPSKARNRGVTEADGELIIFLDDDTEPASDFLTAHAALHTGAVPLAAIGPMVRDTSRREPIWIAWEHAMLQKQYDAFARREWWPPGPKHFYTGNASLRRTDFLSIGGFDLHYTRQEDVELAHRLQRERGVAFTFAPETAVVHRPLRTFESWARVPLAYGALDVERARRGDVGWDLVRHGYAGRNALTRLLARTEWAAPFLVPLIRQILKAAAISLHTLGLRKLAIVALSALYNLLYLEGAKTALGGLQELRRTVYAPPAPSNGGAL